MCAMLMTRKSANAVKTSRRLVFAMARRSGCVRYRPTTTTAPMAAMTFAKPASRRPSEPTSDERRGMTATRGIAATSWKRRMPKETLPIGDPSTPRSRIVCTAIAVDDSATARPAMTAPRHGRPMVMPATASTAPHATIWAAPPPNTLLRMAQSRLGSSSRPMRKSMRTTPNSAKSRIEPTSVTKPSPDGPMTQPAARYPRTEPSLNRLAMGTKTIVAPR